MKKVGRKKKEVMQSEHTKPAIKPKVENGYSRKLLNSF